MQIPKKNDSGSALLRADRVLESLRYADYDAHSMIGELVDNSLEANANNVWVQVKTKPVKVGAKTIETILEIAVIDDGDGMSEDAQGRCLVLGECARPARPDGRRGIGRFGVGLTLGGISVAERIEVYTRCKAVAPFTYTYLDLDEVKTGVQQLIPIPVKKQPPPECAKLIEKKSGTIVVLKRCDRISGPVVEAAKVKPASEILAGLPAYLGRTYREFIAAGRNLWVGGERVFLHDPLFLLSPTKFEAGKKAEPKAKLWGEPVEIMLDVPGQPGKRAAVTIRMTLLPKEWRKERGAGGLQHALERRIDENEGISVLRANREVLYGPVPYILGRKGRAKSEDIDRWWGCEISFPPELDDYFHVRFIKRGAEPVAALRDKIREIIGPAVEDMRKRIREDFDETEAEKTKKGGVFRPAEDQMAQVDRFLPKGKTSSITPAESKRRIEETVEEDTSDPSADKEKKKAELRKKPYALVPVRYPSNFLFETVHTLDNIIVKLNVNHPFYSKVFAPLCGSIEVDTAGSNRISAAQQKARDGIILLLFSFAKAESLLIYGATSEGEGSPDELDVEKLRAALEQLRAQWGISLATVLNNQKG